MLSGLSSLFRGEPDSRLFVHLMWKASSKYASFTPSTLQLGDYGHVDRSSGEFIREGNILVMFPELKSELEKTHETPAGSHIFKGSYKIGTYKELDASVVGQVVEARIKVGWSFGKDRFAALVLIDPVLVEIAYEGNLHRFLIKHKELRDKALVTQLYKCTTYAALLTNGEKGEAYAGFHADSSLPAQMTTGRGGTVTWSTQCETGTWHTGIYEPGKYRYTPLCTLRSIRPREWGKIRGAPKVDNPDDIDVMLDYYPPWNDLEADGTENSDEEGNYDDDDDSDNMDEDN